MSTLRPLWVSPEETHETEGWSVSIRFKFDNRRDRGGDLRRVGEIRGAGVRSHLLRVTFGEFISFMGGKKVTGYTVEITEGDCMGTGSSLQSPVLFFT